MELTITVPDVDAIIKDLLLGEYFSEVEDADKLLTELVEKGEDLDTQDDNSLSGLEYGEIWCKYEDDSIGEVWSLIEGEAQSFRGYILDLAKNS